MNPFILAGLVFAAIGLVQLSKEESETPLLPAPGKAGKDGKPGAAGKAGKDGKDAPVITPPNDG